MIILISVMAIAGASGNTQGKKAQGRAVPGKIEEHAIDCCQLALDSVTRGNLPAVESDSRCL